MSSSSSFVNSMPECVRGIKMTPHSSVLCLSQIRVEADIQWYKIVLHASGPESTLFYGVLLVFSIRYQVSSLPASKVLRRSSFAKALATWPNKYHWFRWLMSPEKKTRTWNRTCWCKLQSLLIFSTFFKIFYSLEFSFYIF